MYLEEIGLCTKSSNLINSQHNRTLYDHLISTGPFRFDNEVDISSYELQKP